MNTQLTLTYLYRPGTRFNVKTTNTQLEYNTLICQNRGSLFTNCVCLLYKYSSCAVLICHSKMYANSTPILSSINPWERLNKDLPVSIEWNTKIRHRIMTEMTSMETSAKQTIHKSIKLEGVA